MANLLVLMELCGGAVLQTSLEALGLARRLGTTLGGTVYALLPLPDAPAYGDEDSMARCARYGADKVVLLTDEALEGEVEMRFGTHGRAVLAACEQLPPTLLLMAATPGARDLAPRVAARLGALYLPEGLVSAQDGVLYLHDRGGLQLADQDGDVVLEHPAVVTITAGRYAVARGVEEAEMVIAAPPAGPRDFVQVGLVECPQLAVVGGPEAAVPWAVRVPVEQAVLVLALGVPVPAAAVGLCVAIGPAAAADPLAHLALVREDPGQALAELGRELGGAVAVEGPA